ncbi:MFS transporter [Mycetocola zhadangensis]|uniref:MFS transporter n=1 Tax=Mycetocola zhadangensis TaxID=1164595 RepID=A0A3L7ISV7_9MICO|nr:MFS transporter [Mycetocola zhadangensis]RLQ81336.1 MFS transporter [Mycetocola zhadangensis]GGF02603.1 MFS transporter [Mycetocola zhadangensis]
MTLPQSSRLARLDALPFTKKHRKLLVGSGVGWALDAMDVGLISFVLAQLAVTWQLGSTELSWIASAGFVGMAVGASLGGLLADRLGRRQVFAITLLVFGIATGAAALSWSLGVLIVLRFIVGLGLGAELPVASTYMSEFAPPRIRGRVIVLLEAFWAVGWTVAALIGYFIVPLSDNGWRWALAIGAVPAIYAVIVRFAMPESVRFLEARGRTAEAEATVRLFEESAGRADAVAPVSETAQVDEAADSRTGNVSSAVPAAHPRLTARQQVAALWAASHRTQTLALWVVWFCVNFSYYGAFVWLPSLLVASGFSLVKSFEYTLIITLAQLPGYLVAAYLVEKWGRNKTLAVFLTGSALSAVAFGMAELEWQVIGAGMLLSFFNLGAWGALYAVTPELYPTELRATGSGWAAGIGRIASIIAPLLVPILTGIGGSVLLFSVFAAFFLVAAGAALTLADKRGKALEEFAPLADQSA